DLAPVLARELYDVDKLSAFFDIMQQDPTLADVKLIAEPWDVGPGGYQVGNFPVRWTEWNGQYRDAVRKFWKGEKGQVSEMASRLAGSSDIFSASDRGVYASINFITAHDGYTLRDLVSYEQKHNEANGEHNQDGHNDNISRNWGVEGETSDPAIIEMRYRLMRTMLATLAFSQGVPMLAHGDEIGRTQCGNNNAYAQDNELTWMNWDLDPAQRELQAFTRKLLALRQLHPVLRRRHFFRGAVIPGSKAKDVTWLRPDGTEITDADWGDPNAHCFGMLIDGMATDERDERGHVVSGDTLLLLLNSGEAPARFTMPTLSDQKMWVVMVDTAKHELPVVRRGQITVDPHTLMLLRYGTDRRIATGDDVRHEPLTSKEKHTP
ncbi:MAG: glycogen debranching enzyme GlgX, partial [bacterium]